MVPLLVDEPGSAQRRAIVETNPVIVTWWGSRLECESALERRRRERILSFTDYEFARQRLRHFSTTWHEIAPSEQVRMIAGRMLRVHALKATDALQLGAALIACEFQTESHVLVTGDGRLAEAARLEGFAVA